jgi:hypothetical protein
VIGLFLHQSVFAKKKKEKRKKKSRKFLAWSLSTSTNFAAQDVNDVSALPGYGDDQFLELYYFACF